jgi:hypothetical protein
MADYPDVYADGFSVTAGPFGVTVTFTRTEPTGEAGPHEEPTVIVARVRFSQPLAGVLSDTMRQVAAAAQVGQPEGKTIKH